MNRKWNKRILRYGITGAIGAGMVALTLKTHGFQNLTAPVDRYRVLTDAFTIPGVLLLCIGLLLWISTTGVFNPIAYAFRYLASRLPFTGIEEESYYDYVERKRDEKRTGYGFLLITGGVFFGIALIFLVLFYRVY